MDPKKNIIGIDLGTSNITLSYGGLEEKEIKSFDISQISSPGKIHKKNFLAASLFLGGNKTELEENKKLPWLTEAKSSSFIAGSYASEKSLERPDQTITSAKSWLCHKHVDPKEPLLPWASQITSKISAFDVICSFLEHLKLVFNWDMKTKLKKDVSLTDFDTVITVPASFDEDARRLVYEAAKAVGFKNMNLLEEPQAALYSWILDHEEKWREEITPGDLILVCDVGGGTSDFSLVCAGDHKGKLTLERISVGKHLLLGGDNMDHALAYSLKNKFEKKGAKLDRWQYFSLVGQVKKAKEKFFEDKELKETSLSVASKGSSLLATTKSIPLTREDVETCLTEGFFPLTEKDELPSFSNQIALQDLGLEYETETAITKHLASFLTKSAKNISSSKKLQEILKSYGRNPEQDLSDGFIKPSAILFNGGVFKGTPLKKRVLNALEKWDCQDVKELPGYNLDLAVSKGATYYAKIKKSGKGIRIQAGTARSYYIGVESSGIAIPGIPPSLKGLCVVPQGTKEGTKLPSPDKKFGLITGREVQFRFFSSEERAGDGVGYEVGDAKDFLNELPTMKVALDSKKGASELVPVSIESYVNDVGILEVSMKNEKTNKKWNLEFNVRKTEN